VPTGNGQEAPADGRKVAAGIDLRRITGSALLARGVVRTIAALLRFYIL
jgi:hypothetical protein